MIHPRRYFWFVVLALLPQTMQTYDVHSRTRASRWNAAVHFGGACAGQVALYNWPCRSRCIVICAGTLADRKSQRQCCV